MRRSTRRASSLRARGSTDDSTCTHDRDAPAVRWRRLGAADTPDFAFDVAVSGSVAYVADGTAGLQVINVSNPANPVIFGSVGTPGAAFGVALSGTVAYVADQASGLQVIDVSSCPCLPACAADLDGDGDVGFADLTTVLGAWGPCPPFAP